MEESIHHGKTFIEMVENLTTSEVVDYLRDYLFEKRKNDNKDSFITNQTYICWREVYKTKNQQEKLSLAEDIAYLRHL